MINITEYFIEITASEGMRLTDGESVFDNIIYAPLDADVSIYKEITNEEAERILQEQEDLQQDLV